MERTQDRVILHIDCNSFFASVESVLRPELKNIPMAVCGDPEKRHGIILSKNELAKQCGIKTAETIWQAKQKCKDLVLVTTHYDKYSEYSAMCNEIYLRYTNFVEPFGIDESWLDITGSLNYFKDTNGTKIANEIRGVIKKELGITVSVGVSFNKVFAKLGSDYKKPDATTVIKREDVERLVYPLPISNLLFVGRKTAQELVKLGIRTIGDLTKANKDMIAQRFGKNGIQMYDYACGQENSPVADWYGEKEQVKSVGNGSTFEYDITDKAELENRILLLCDSVGRRLRKKGLCAKCVAVTLKTPDFETVTKQTSLTHAISTTPDIYNEAIKVFNEMHKYQPIRAATITVTQLCGKSGTAEQISLFDDTRGKEKKEKLQSAVDYLQEKYGEKVINNAGIIVKKNK